MTNPASLSRTGLLTALVAALVLTLLPAPSAQAAGETLWVATWGDDYAADGYSTPPNSSSEPWRTIRMAIRRAEPGDTIVVRGGTYVEAAGWGAVPGTAAKPITLTNHQDENVVLKGTLQLDGADHWKVDGIKVRRDPARSRTEFLVKFSGGTGWSFVNGEISGGIGVSNLMINDLGGEPANNFRVANSCIHSNEATGDPKMNDHNIYLYPGLDSTGGVIERNLIFDSPNGAGIKAGGPNGNRGAANVVIRFNTLGIAGAGLTVPRSSHDVLLERNLIAIQRLDQGTDGTQFDAGIVANTLYGTNNVARDNAVAGFPLAVRNTNDTTRPLIDDNNRKVSTGFNSTTSCSAWRPTSDAAKYYGHLASGGALPPELDGSSGSEPAPSVDFTDDDGSPFENAIEWLATSGVTKGCNPPTNTRYCPDDPVTRAQMATFLTRALDLPAGSTTFSDVGGDNPFRKAIASLADAGITRGCNPPSNTNFCPDEPVTRQQMAAFLTRALGLPNGSSSFSDVASDSPFRKAIASLADAGITRGCNPPSNTRFCPDDPVTRGQMAAFLYRALG